MPRLSQMLRFLQKWSDIRPSLVTHTRNLCSAFNPSKVHTYTQQWLWCDRVYLSHTHDAATLSLSLSLSHTHTHTHTHTLVGFDGLRGLSIGVMVYILYQLYVLLPYTNPTPKLSPHRRLCISTFPQKTHSVWFISVLNYGDTENVLINHLLLVIPMSYPCHYTHLCPHKPQKHAQTHTQNCKTQHMNSQYQILKLITKHTVADSEAPDCQSQVRISSSHRFTILSSIKCIAVLL